MKGYIHSIESFGTVDGPGVRYVVFFQGCPMRCLYCHNPDTWEMKNGRLADVDEILAGMERNREFYKTGGLTATGGEAMGQPEFLTELFEKAKKKGFSTCLDTSGIYFCAKRKEKIDRLIRSTDLVLLDIKHMDTEGHKKLTGYGNENIFAFAEYLKEKKVPVWIRHVVVPGLTDSEEQLTALGKYGKSLPNVEKIEVLPYHTMGEVKYENLGIEYPLRGIRQLKEEEKKRAEDIISRAMESK